MYWQKLECSYLFHRKKTKQKQNISFDNILYQNGIGLNSNNDIRSSVFCSVFPLFHSVNSPPDGHWCYLTCRCVRRLVSLKRIIRACHNTFNSRFLGILLKDIKTCRLKTRTVVFILTEVKMKTLHWQKRGHYHNCTCKLSEHALDKYKQVGNVLVTGIWPNESDLWE